MKRADDALVLAALVAIGVACAAFRYLPMVDLPQHYAMVSIVAHLHDPAYGFAERYTLDFVGRPYATVYWLGAALAHVAPLGVAMRFVVATCTVAPFAGAWALLVATGRPRVWLLASIPFAFGSLWHWGFLNFLLGTGLFLGGLAIVVVASRRPSRRSDALLFAWSFALFFTHFHGFVMLVLFAPIFAWAERTEPTRRALPHVARTIAPLAPATIAAIAFVLLTWGSAEGSWARMNPGLGERVARFADFLGAGLPEPWPKVWLVTAVGSVALAFALGGAQAAPRARVASAVALVGQVAMYLVLPLNTNTATFVSARHALLVVLLALPLLPALDGARERFARVAMATLAAVALFVCARHLACFDREARDFDGVLAAMQPKKRVLPLVYARGSACTHAATFPYLHFAGYYMAARGGELARTFATVWNVPIRYRSDYPRYPIREQLEWAPQQVSADDVRHFDYVLVRGPRAPRIPAGVALREIATSGAWTLLENDAALPPELPAR